MPFPFLSPNTGVDERGTEGRGLFAIWLFAVWLTHFPGFVFLLRIGLDRIELGVGTSLRTEDEVDPDQKLDRMARAA